MGEPGRRCGKTAMKASPWLLAESGDLEAGRTVVLDPIEARHLVGPLRRRQGDEIVLADGHGSVAEAKLVAIGKERVEAEIVAVRCEPRPASGGVGRFVPMETGRAQVRGKDLAGRVEHWRRIALQALKQCRRPWAMDVGNVVRLADLVEGSEEAGVVADREGSSIGELPEGAGALLMVGPEGGFTSEESELFDCRGWPRLRLGPHILRAETAAVVGGAMMVMRSQNR